jgi:hypothetical protein
MKRFNSQKKGNQRNMKTPTCDYANDGKRITQPGKFEGEPVFAPYYYGLGLEGFADRDNGNTYTFRFAFNTTDSEVAFRKELQEWLERKRTLTMVEDSLGFVHCY